ncbi:Uncharacterised protein [Chryseobacterium carnipullorum]|nr:Uncharacterised protein [Chryseobacterium carnipullorum]
MFSVFAIFEGVTKYPLMQIAAVIVFVYFSWAVGQFFDKSRIASYFKALVSYILGMITKAGSNFPAFPNMFLQYYCITSFKVNNFLV